MKFGTTSVKNIIMLTYDLQWILREALALEIIDFTVVCAYRNEEDQTSAYESGNSKVRWPNSKHNKNPAEAMDVVPYINGKISYEYVHCCVLAGVILAVAKKLGVGIRWGGNWDMDYEPVTDQDFQDLAHYEEVRRNHI